MPNSAKTGFPIVGVVFLLLALFKFTNGEDWVVWAIVGFVFGGLGVFPSDGSKGGPR